MGSLHGWHPQHLSWCKQCHWELLHVCARAWAGAPCLLSFLMGDGHYLLGMHDPVGLPTAPKAKQGIAPAVLLYAAASAPLCEPKLSALTWSPLQRSCLLWARRWGS